MKTLSGPDFAAHLVAADVSQAAFARLTGVTARQVNAWCRGHAIVPKWAAIVSLVLAEFTPEALTLTLEEAVASRDEPIAAGLSQKASTASRDEADIA